MSDDKVEAWQRAREAIGRTWLTLRPTQADYSACMRSKSPPTDARPEYWLRAQYFRRASIFSYSYDPSSHQTLLIVAGLQYSIPGDHTKQLDQALGDGP